MSLRCIGFVVGLGLGGAASAVADIELQITVGVAVEHCTPPQSQNCALPPPGFVLIPPGEDLVVGYKVTNTGTVTLTHHDLVDSTLGQILDDFPYTLPPKSFAYIAQRFTAPMTPGTRNRSATWTSDSTTTTPVSDLALYAYRVQAPVLEHRVTIAPAASVCSNPNDVSTCTLPTTPTTPYVAGQKLAIGFQIRNIGDVGTVIRHDLVDESLGAILTDFPYTLEPDGLGYIVQLQTPPGPFLRTSQWTGRTATGYAVTAFDTYSAGPWLFVDGFE